MKRSSYRGDHKGSTLKARSKTAFGRVLNSTLALVLVVGLAPSMSFAGEETVIVRASDADLTEQVIEQQVPEEMTELQNAGVADSSETLVASESNSEEGAQEPSAPAMSMNEGDVTITAPADTKTLSLADGKTAFYVQNDVTLNVTATNVSVSATASATDNGVSATVIGGSVTGSTYTGTISIAANASPMETVHTVVVTVKDGDEEQTQMAYVVVDNKKPKATVSWAAASSDNWIGSVNNNEVAFITNATGQSAVQAIATVTVTDYNPSFPEGSDNALGGDGANTIKLDTNGTSSELVPAVKTDWTRKEQATDAKPAEYTCEIAFTAKESLTVDASYNAKLSVTTVDKGGNMMSSSTDLSGTMKVTAVDTNGPTVEVKKGDTAISITQNEPTYFKKDDTLSVTITDNNYDASKISATIGSTPFDAPTTSSTAKTLTAGTDFATEGPNTVSITGTDNVGNAITAYTGYVHYDSTDPTVNVTYTSGDTASKTLESGKTAYIGADNATVNVSLSDASPGVLDDSASEVKYQKTGGSEETAQINNGTATINLTDLTDGDTYTITAKAVDKAGNETTYTGTIVAYRSTPTYSVVWADTNKLEDSTLHDFYGARVATVTIVDNHFDAEHAKSCITATGGSISWSGQTATVTYGGSNKKDCKLEVAYTNLAGTEASVTNDVTDNAATGSTYTSNQFNIVVNPIIDVRFMQNTSIVAPRTITRGGSDVPCYVLDNNGELTVTVSVIDPAFATDPAPAYTVTGTTTPGTLPTLSSFTGSGAVRTATLTFTSECDVSNLTITPPTSYVGSGDTEKNLWTVGGNDTSLTDGAYVYNVSSSNTFTIDNTPPTLVSVTYTTNPSPIEYSTKKYYKNAATAEVAVTEHNLNNNGMPVAVTLATGDNTPVSQTLSGSNGAWTSTVTFAKVENTATEYTLGISGKDLVDKALVADTNSGLSVAFDDATGAGSYSGSVVIDAAAPTLTVTQDGTSVDTGSTVYTKQSVTIKATVSDVLIDPSKITVSATYTVNGENNEQTLDLDVPTSGLTDNSYDYEFTLPADDDATKHRTYTVSVSGTDAVGNELDEYTATIVVDPVSPVLDVTLNPYDQADSANPKVPFTIKDDEQGVRTYYYNTDVTASVTVTDNAQIAADGITAKVFGTEIKSTAGTTFEPTNQTYSTEGTTTIEVTGTDAAGNPLTAKEGSVAADGLKDGAYKANVVVDKTKPTVDVTYKEIGASDAATSLTYDATTGVNPNRPLASGDVEVTAKFNDDGGFDANSATFTYQLGASEERDVADADVVWDGSVAVFTIKTDGNTDQLCRITIDGDDFAGNKLAGKSDAPTVAQPYKSQLQIDKKAPVVTVETTTDQNNKSADGTIDYFKGDVDLVVTIKDGSFDEANTTPADLADRNVISLDGDVTNALTYSEAAGSGWTKSDPDAEGIYTYTYRKTISDAGTYPVAVTVHDRVGGETTARYQHGEATSFVIDTYSPDVDVVMSKARYAQDGSADYYNEVVTATITVKDANFDAAANTPDKVIAFVPVGKVAIPGAWTSAGDEYSVSIEIPDNDFGETYSFLVKGSDLATNSFMYHYGDNNVDGTPNSAGNNYTTSAGDSLGAFASSFLVDSKSPDIEIKMGEAKIATRNDRDYFGTANANGELVASVTVTDPTFQSDSALITDAAGNALSHSAWVRNGNTFVTVVSFSENTDGKASTLKVVANDKITTLKAGSDVHKVAYGYGDAAVSDSATGGNVKTIDSVGTALASKSFVLDLTAPNLTAKEATGFATKWVKDSQSTPYLFYTANGSGVTVTMSDANEISKAEAGSPFSLSPAPTTDLGAISTKTVELIQSTDVADRDKNNATMSSALVKLTDYVGNYSIWNISANGTVFKVAEGKEAGSANASISIKDGSSVHPTVMVLDNSGATLTWSSAPTVGQYYNTAQSAGLHVREMNFDYLRELVPGRTIATVYRADNTAGAGAAVYRTYVPGNFTGSASDWDSILAFDAEGHYTVTAQFEDIAGNPSNNGVPLKLDEFTLDWTVPTCTITWDNNDSRNGMYYRAGRTATITVTEHNFLASDFTVETTGAVSGWSDNGDTHTCTVSFTTDGRYTLSVSGHDRAGNQMTAITEPEFVIDLTAPTIDFSNVTAQTAYNGEIAPVINYHDEANFDTNGMTWTLTGNKHGGQTFAASQGSSGNDGTVSFSDFPRQVEADDIYTLQAHLTDMAGNEADNSITFSVNRFGSNFIILDEKAFAENKGYLAEPIEIRVQEINVSGALNDEHGVSVTHGLTTENLDRKQTGTPTSEGFYVEAGSDNAGWSSYTYHIGSGNFSDDGNYHVVISSTDAATNLNNSASYYDPDEHAVADAEVSFILDTADPIIDGISVTDGEIADAGAKALSFTVTDNIDIDEVKVVVDGEEQTVEPEMGGLCTVDLPAKAFTARDMQIVATDLAGRTAEASVLGFHWTDNFVELNLPFVVGGVIVVAAAVAGGVFFVRRRNGQ